MASVVILAGTCTLLYPSIASWFSQREQSRVTSLAMAALGDKRDSGAEELTNEMGEARAYNKALASGAVLKANERIAVGDPRSGGGAFDYDSLLPAGADGLMARLQYESLGIDLPVYHGTADDTLTRGVGHLEGTSLPVGGVGTRAVLTGHRGLPSATLFDNLDRAKAGDTFVLTVLGQALTYRVVETQVIEPDQTREIVADPHRDLVTLITCTPLGINSHRILVTGERVLPTPEAAAAGASSVPDLPGFPWWAVVVGAVTMGLGMYVWHAGRRSRRCDAEPRMSD